MVSSQITPPTNGIFTARGQDAEAKREPPDPLDPGGSEAEDGLTNDHTRNHSRGVDQEEVERDGGECDGQADEGNGEEKGREGKSHEQQQSDEQRSEGSPADGGHRAEGAGGEQDYDKSQGEPHGPPGRDARDLVPDAVFFGFRLGPLHVGRTELAFGLRRSGELSGASHHGLRSEMEGLAVELQAPFDGRVQVQNASGRKDGSPNRARHGKAVASRHDAASHAGAGKDRDGFACDGEPAPQIAGDPHRLSRPRAG